MMNATVLYVLAKQHQQDLIDDGTRRRVLASARRKRGVHARGRSDR